MRAGVEYTIKAWDSVNLLDMVQDDGYFMEDDTVGRRFTVEAEDIQEMEEE